MKANRILFILGLLVIFSAVMLLLLNVGEAAIAAATGILGIGLIALSGRKINAKSIQNQPVEQVVRTVYAPDQKQRALIRQRTDGSFHIEIQKFIHEYSPDVGSHDRWERQSASICGSLAEAVEIAAGRVGAGTDDFFNKET